jgi:hypothetical protein
MNWYYDQGGQRQGPVQEAELDRLLASGAINQNTLVWCEGMANWTPLREARPAAGAGGADVPEGWIRCTATGRYFPPSQIVYLDGKPYSAEAKPGIVQGVMQAGVLPGGGEAERTGPAWEQREQVGFFKAIWETVKGVLLDPTRTFETMKREGGIGTPLAFHVLLGSVGGIASLFYQLVFQIGGLSSIPPEAREKLFTAIGGAGAGLAIAMVGGIIALPLLMVISTFISSGVMHLSLMICSGAKQPFETTLRTYCYCSGSGALFQLIPFCGASIGGLWALVCMCIGMAKTHEIGTGRAVCAVLLPSVVCCVLIVLFIGAVFGMVLSTQGLNH